MRGCEKIGIRADFAVFPCFHFEEALLNGWPLQNENPGKSHRNQPNPNFFTASAHPVVYNSFTLPASGDKIWK